MKRNFLYILLATVGLLFAGGCSVDEPLSMPGADGGTTLNLLVPAPDMAHTRTRAENNPHGDRIAQEGTIERLSVVGFYTLNGKTQHFFHELTDQDATAADNNVYRQYKIAVVPAAYKLYVLGNVTIPADLKSDLENKNNTESKENGLENRVNQITYSYTALPTADGGLPMAAVQTAEVSENQDKQVVVDMQFLCAKVRLTVLYNNAFGTSNPFKIDGLKAYNCYTPSTVFLGEGQTHGTGSTKLDPISGIGTAGHYAWTPTDENSELSYWTAMPEEGNDPLDAFVASGETLSGDSWTHFAYQNTAYLPECVGKGSESTYLELEAGTLKSKINIGCDASTNTHEENTGGKVERGNFYDIVALVEGGDITYKWRVTDWTPQNLAVQLAGLSSLFLEKTEIDKMDGETPVEIGYTSDAPKLTFTSDKVKYGTMAEELPLFDVDEDPVTHKLIVTVNPNLPINNDLIKNMGFWVESGNIHKYVLVKEVDLKPYLRLLPKLGSVSIRNIANEPRYRIYFDFATNAEGLTLKLTSFSNSNTSKGCALTGETSDGYKTGNGYFFEICGADSVAVTKPIDVKALNGGVNLMDPANLLSGKSYPTDGFIRLTILEPTNPSYYSKEIKGTFTASVSGLEPKTAEFEILPNPTVYTIHFKVKDASGKGDKWGNPHIYVYQPLYYDGYPVFGHKGHGGSDTEDATTHIWSSGGQANMEWLEYSFTGNLAFKGWKRDGNTDGVDNLNYTTKWFLDGGGSKVLGYNLCSDWGDPGAADTFDNNPKYSFIKLVDNTKSSCSHCAGKEIQDLNNLWPGVGMTYEEDEEYVGWYKIELPLLVKPGQAVVMFANSAEYKDYRCQGEQAERKRWPRDKVPGIPIPDYADKEAWFLYDPAIENSAFSDDRIESYSSSGNNQGSGETTKDDTHYLICWPTSWTKSADNQTESLDNIFMKDSSDKVHPLGEWRGKNQQYKTDVNQSTGKTWVWVPISNFSSHALDTDGHYIFILNCSKGQSGDSSFNSTNVSIKIIKDNPLDTDLKSKLDSENVVVSQYFEITNAS